MDEFVIKYSRAHINNQSQESISPFDRSISTFPTKRYTLKYDVWDSNFQDNLVEPWYSIYGIQLSPQGGEAGYRAAIHEVVPGIKVLDDVPLSLGKEVGTELASRSSVFMLSEAGMKKDWRIIQESIKQGWQVEDGKEGGGREAWITKRKGLEMER